MCFCCLFLFYLLVCNECDSTRKNAEKISSKTFVRALSPSNLASKIVLPLSPSQLARQLHRNIRSALLRSGHSLADHNFGWLYLHPKISETGEPTFDAEEVRRVFEGAEDFPFVKNGLWPSVPAETNFMFGVPLRKKPSNKGHAEHMLMKQLGEMQRGFKMRNEDCPHYTFLGIVRDPCNYLDETGCAYDIINGKKQFTSQCPITDFYLYVDNLKIANKYLHFWEDTKRIMEANNVNLIHGPEETGFESTEETESAQTETEIEPTERSY